ncbi:MAG TPA: pyridoxal-phosphate dependent enzyme [Dehalococcoidia bacterium]
MTAETAPDLEFTPATAADMPFIAETIERLRLDGEWLAPEQFITLRRHGRILAFGRIKPYEETHELGSVAVVEEERSQGLGEKVTRELIRRFPQDEVYITTDLPAYYERMGFLRTAFMPPELVDKLERVCAANLRENPVGMVYDRRIEQLPTLADVYRAKHVLEPHLQRTPLVRNPAMSRELGFEAWLKLENLQPIGAFKVRGGVYLSASMTDEERSRGIIGASTGNHGQSLAYGAKLAGIKCIIVMPEEANPMKVDSMRALGAEVLFHGADFEEAREWAEEHAASEGVQYIHHSNAPRLVTGVSTMSIEVIEDLPDVDVILVPVGGGSGALAHCLVAKELRPGVEVIGVQAAGAPAVYESWKSHTLREAGIDTAAEGLATGAAYHPALRTLIDRLDDFVLVSEAEIRDAMLILARTAHVIAEEAGAAATAGAVQLQKRLAGKNVVIMVSGGNVPLDHLRRVLLEA